MEKVKLIIGSKIPHVSQIVTGFLMLKQQGLDLEIQTDYDGILSRMPVIQAEYRGLRLVYDMGDGYNVPEDVITGLENCDIYFKRSFLRRRTGR